MSMNATLTQGAHTLKLIDDQGLDLCQVNELHLYLPVLVRGVKNRTLPSLDTFRAITDGWAEVKIPEYLVDFDKAPFIPSGWSVLPDSEQLPNRVRGVMAPFDSAKIRLHLVKEQREGWRIEGNELHKKLETIPVCGAQLLDFYLANTHLIPPVVWRKKSVSFWGTIYHCIGGNLVIRCLSWGGCEWGWRYKLLDDDWYENEPAAILAS
jgi:hypothetical protein